MAPAIQQGQGLVAVEGILKKRPGRKGRKGRKDRNDCCGEAFRHRRTEGVFQGFGHAKNGLVQGVDEGTTRTIFISLVREMFHA